MPESPALSSNADTIDRDADFSRVLIALFKGVMYQEIHGDLWFVLVRKQMAVRDYVGRLGLDLALDEGEGFAYLVQTEQADASEALPRLVAKRRLSFMASLILALLRKRLVEAEAAAGERLILSRSEIMEMVRVFLPDRSNEARLVDQVQKDVNRVHELGFIRSLKGQDDMYEVLRIIKAFVDVKWLAEFDEKLGEYAASRGVTDDQGEE